MAGTYRSICRSIGLRQVTHMRIMLLTNCRQRGTLYFCLSRVNVSFTPLSDQNLWNAHFWVVVLENLDWSSGARSLFNLPRKEHQHFHQDISPATNIWDRFISFLGSYYISRLKAWPWIAFIHHVMAIDTTRGVKMPVLRSSSRDLQLVIKRITRDVTAKSLFKGL